MTVSSATLSQSAGIILLQFAAACLSSARDATAVTRVVYGLADGNDYGRYFAGQDPLVTFAPAAASLAGLADQLATQLAAVGQAAVAALALAGDAARFGQGAAALADAVRLACADPADAVRILAGLARFTPAVPVSGLPADGIGQELYVLVRRAALRVRLAAAASLVAASADYRPTSQQDAAALRDTVADLLDALGTICADVFDDATARAIEAARVAVVEDLTARGADLAPVVTRSFGAALPAKVLAYRLYGDASRAGDLVARNEPPHPSFMPTQIEALAV